MKMEQTECSETSAHKIQTPGSHLKGSIQHIETWRKFEMQKNYLKNVERHNKQCVCVCVRAILQEDYDITLSHHNHHTPLWDMTQRMLAVVYRRIVTAYQFLSSAVKQSETVCRLKSRGKQISDTRSRAPMTRFCTAASNICGSSVCHLRHAAILEPIIWRRLLDF
jgi:hypothetical protein